MSGEENTTQSIITCHAATSEFTLPILMAELTEKLNHLSFPIFWRIKKKKNPTGKTYLAVLSLLKNVWRNT